MTAREIRYFPITIEIKANAWFWVSRTMPE
jgi:hypothetical protein